MTLPLDNRRHEVSYARALGIPHRRRSYAVSSRVTSRRASPCGGGRPLGRDHGWWRLRGQWTPRECGDATEVARRRCVRGPSAAGRADDARCARTRRVTASRRRRVDHDDVPEGDGDYSSCFFVCIWAGGGPRPRVGRVTNGARRDRDPSSRSRNDHDRDPHDHATSHPGDDHDGGSNGGASS